MLNLRADSSGELAAHLDGVDVQRAVDFISTLNAVQNAGPVTQPQQGVNPNSGWQPQGPSQPSTPPPSQPSGPPADGMYCQHGPRRRYDGKKGNKAYTGYFCPLEKGDPNQCAPVWA